MNINLRGINSSANGRTVVEESLAALAALSGGVPAADSMATLRALPENLLLDGATFWLHGYTAGSTTGCGFFVYEAYSGQSDNNGSVILPTNNPAATPGGRLVRRLLDGQLPSPEMFGGIADGSIDVNGNVTGSDNTVAIQRCVNAYGRCHLGKGIYGLDGYIYCSDSYGVLSGEGSDRSVIAKLNGNVAHSSMYPWGSFRGDVCFASNVSAGIQVRGICFDANGKNRVVTGRTGYTQPGTNILMIMGTGQLVADCTFRRIGAYSGSTSGARTPGMPETFSVVLGYDPGLASSTEVHADWVRLPGPKVLNCLFEELVPQVDPDDFSSDGCTPEITIIGTYAMGGTWKFNSAASASGTSLTTPTSFFESWMVGRFGGIGTNYERVKIVAVNSPTSATLESAVSQTYSGVTLKISKPTRLLHEGVTVEGCTFRNLKLWRNSNTDKQLRSIHLVTLSDHINSYVRGNRVEDCDGPLYYQDNGLSVGLNICYNTIIRGTYGVHQLWGTYALTIKDGPGSGAWFYDTAITGNHFRHGYRALAKFYTIFIDKAAVTDRLLNHQISSANTLNIASSNQPQEFTDWFHPATASLPVQRYCVEHTLWSDNYLAIYNDFYTSGIFYVGVWHSELSLDELRLTHNTVDNFGYDPETDRWYDILEPGWCFVCYDYNRTRFKHNGNVRGSTGQPAAFHARLQNRSYAETFTFYQAIFSSSLELAYMNGSFQEIGVLTGNTTISISTEFIYDAFTLSIEFKQDSVGNRTVSLNSSTIIAPDYSGIASGPNKSSLLVFTYSTRAGKWLMTNQILNY